MVDIQIIFLQELRSCSLLKPSSEIKRSQNKVIIKKNQSVKIIRIKNMNQEQNHFCALKKTVAGLSLIGSTIEFVARMHCSVLRKKGYGFFA